MKQTRRFFLMSFIGMVSVSLFPPLLVRSQESESISVEWRVPAKQVEIVREQLDFDGEITGDMSTVDEDRGLPLIYILVGTFALGQIAKALLEIYRDFKYSGVYVYKDKQGKLRIENNSELPPGIILIDQGDKIEVIFRESEQPSSKDIVQALIPLVKK
jgi:hypothetical protein